MGKGKEKKDLLKLTFTPNNNTNKLILYILDVFG